jgi:hydrogenase nickel incorporation protein HypB
MCTTCGCGAGVVHHGDHDHHDGDHHHDHHHDHRHEEARTVRIERDLLAKNERLAAVNRRAVATAGVAVFNVIGSPGAGKTALLESIIRRVRTAVPLAVLEGDQATDRDARRIESAGCRVRQINTGAGCHLDASMVDEGLTALAPPRGSIVFVENVGNLVCPALFDLGELAKIVVMSVTEGEDKPIKYPHVFRASSLMVLTKTDLLPHVPFDADRCVAFAREVNPKIEVLRVSALHEDGIDDVCGWVRARAVEVWMHARPHDEDTAR